MVKVKPQTVNVEMKVKIKMSMWDALKLRIAGIKHDK